MSFYNAASIPFASQLTIGGLPNLSGALVNWLQPISIINVGKIIDGYQVMETGSLIQFQGVVQPLDKRRLQQKDIGERNWNSWVVHTLAQIPLETDDTITYLGKQHRVTAVQDCSAYGYYSYECIEDYTGAGPVTV